jgi:hypothetical protein
MGCMAADKPKRLRGCALAWDLTGILAVVVALVLAGPVTAATATPLHLLARSIVSFSSDGERWVVWQVSEGTPIVVFDTRTGHRGEIATPGCELEDQGKPSGEGFRGAAGRFLISCSRVIELLDIRTGALTTLPSGEGRPSPSGEYGPSWSVVGSRYAEGSDAKDRCRQTKDEVKRRAECIALYDIATGVMSDRPQSQVADPDRPGAPPVCPALVARLVEENLVLGEAPWLDLAGYSDGILAAEASRPIRIYRCHGRPMTLPSYGEDRNLQLRGGLLSWDSGHNAATFQEGDDASHGTISSYRLATGERQRLALPRIRVLMGEHPTPRVFGYSTHAANMLFWIATRTVALGKAGVTVATSTVYAGKI